MSSVKESEFHESMSAAPEKLKFTQVRHDMLVLECLQQVDFALKIREHRFLFRILSIFTAWYFNSLDRHQDTSLRLHSKID